MVKIVSRWLRASGSPVRDLSATTCAYADLIDLWPGSVALPSKQLQQKRYSCLPPNAVACSLSHEAAGYLYSSHMAKTQGSDHLILDVYRYVHIRLIS